MLSEILHIFQYNKKVTEKIKRLSAAVCLRLDEEVL